MKYTNHTIIPACLLLLSACSSEPGLDNSDVLTADAVNSNETEETNTPFVATDDFISSRDDGTDPEQIEGRVILEENEYNHKILSRTRSSEQSTRLKSSLTELLADGDPLNDDFVKFRLSFSDSASYIKFVKNSTDSEIQQYADENGLVNTVPKKNINDDSTQLNETFQSRELFKPLGLGAADSCFGKFNIDERNTFHTMWKTFFGAPVFPLPVKYYVNLNGVTTIAVRHDSLTNIEGTRDGECQSGVSAVGAPGDEGGHIIANSLGGFGKKINLTPQDFDVNRRLFASMEDSIKVCVDLGLSIDYVVLLQYPTPTSIRPTSYEIFFNVLHADFGRRIYAFIPNKKPQLQEIIDVQAQADRTRNFCRGV